MGTGFFVFLFWDEENILKLDSDDHCTTLNIVNPENCILQYINFMAYQLYINKTFIQKRKVLPINNILSKAQSQLLYPKFLVKMTNDKNKE